MPNIMIDDVGCHHEEETAEMDSVDVVMIVDQVRVAIEKDLNIFEVTFVAVELADGVPRMNIYSSGADVIVCHLEGLIRVIIDQIRQMAEKFQEHFQDLSFVGIDPQYGMVTIHGDSRAAGF